LPKPFVSLGSSFLTISRGLPTTVGAMQTAGSTSKSDSAFLSIFGAVIVRPWLWFAALSQAYRLVPQGWWRTSPFLPVPSRDYLEFRLVTQYGGGHGVARGSIRSEDVVDYLQWCRRWSSEN
jgi:hypothetical protein